MDRVPLLVATRGPLSGQRYAVTEAGLTVGRGDICDVVIPDAGVSRQHARVLLHNAAVWVQDEGSRNGVFVNGKRVVRHRQLSPGAEMLIGEHAFTLELAPAFPDDPSVIQVTGTDDLSVRRSPPARVLLAGALALAVAAAGLIYALS